MAGKAWRCFVVGLGLWTNLVCAQEPPSAVGPLLKLYRSGKLPAERQPAVIEMICTRGNEHDLRVVLDKLLDPMGMAAGARVKAMVGPNVMASVYYFYDTVHERGGEPPPFLRRIWGPYCALVAETPPEHRHFRTHEYHYTRLHEGEYALIDEQLIRDTCLVGTAEELIAQFRQLEADGLRELIIATGNEHKWRLAADVMNQVIRRL